MTYEIYKLKPLALHKWLCEFYNKILITQKIPVGRKHGITVAVPKPGGCLADYKLESRIKIFKCMILNHLKNVAELD